MKKGKLLGVLLLLLAFSSCKKEESNGIKVYVPAYLKVMAPYANGQTVVFKNGTGHIVTSTVSVYSRFYYTGACSSCASQNNPELITYTLSVGASKFVTFDLTPDPYILFDIYSPQNNYLPGGSFKMLVQDGVSLPVCGAIWHACLPSITLNGVVYTDVLELSVPTGSTGPIRKAYHKPGLGLIGFAYDNGVVYSLN